MSSAAASTQAPHRDWEAWLATASHPASPTEEEQRDRTETRIRDAIARAPDIPSSVWVYAKGSYANNTNVSRDGDVDIAVEWTNTIKVMKWGDTVGMTAEQLGYVPATEPITPIEFRRRVERALATAFDSQTIDTTPDKYIGVTAGSNTLDADVVPCFALNRYDAPGYPVRGHRIFPKSGAAHVDNYPKQNYDNGVAKNNATRRRYKEIVRCTKRLVGELYDERIITRDYPRLPDRVPRLQRAELVLRPHAPLRRHASSPSLPLERPRGGGHLQLLDGAEQAAHALPRPPRPHPRQCAQRDRSGVAQDGRP